ncbi:MAG: response regulator transcription factor [Chitinophagaceae bacterium]
MSEVRVLIIEDEPVIAENIAGYLNNNDFMVSGIAYDSEEARNQLMVNTPDAVLMDINLGSDEDGIDLARFINKNYKVPILFLTSYADKETIQRAKEVEPSAYILKPFHEKALLASLEIAISNYARRHIQHVPILSFSKINKHLITQLSEREFEVLQLIYEGKTNQQIAENIFISINTIKKHINSAYLKLDVPTRTTAIARLLELMTK